MRWIRALSAWMLVVALVGSGCGSSGHEHAKQSALTPGMAKMTIRKGETTQAEVLEVFGPPDLVTHRNDQQVWTYDKIRYDIESSQGYFTVFLAGVAGNSTRSSSTSTMLIIYFDSADIVTDYRMSVVRF